MIKKRPLVNKPASLLNKKRNRSNSRPTSRRRPSGLQYQNLEQRLPLDASFEFAGGVLTIDGFTEDTQLTIDAGNDLVATLDTGFFVGNLLGPGITLEDPMDMEPSVITFTGVSALFVDGSGFSAPSSGLVLNVQSGESLDLLSVDIGGGISINTFSRDFDLAVTELITNGNITQTDNVPGVSTNIDLGALSFMAGGSATFDSLGAATVGGEVGGNLTIVSDVGNVVFNDQFGVDFNNSGAPDGLFVGGNANITVGDGAIGQTTDASVIISGTLDITTDSEGSAPILLNGSNGNDFNQINIENDSSFRNSDIAVFDTDSFDVNFQGFVGVSDILHLAAGRGDAGESIFSNFDGNLTISGSVAPDIAIFQASDGFTQTSGEILTENLLLGGDEISEGRGDFIFNGTVDAEIISDADLLDFDLAVRVRGNLDLATDSEVTVLSAPINYIDGRAPELFQDSYVDGNARIVANDIDFDVTFETTKFVLSVEADVTQTAGTAILTDQLYVEGKRVDLSSDLNDTNQISARGVGDESFVRYSDVGTFRIVSLDGGIEGANANRADLGTLNGIFTDRLPQIDIGVRSFVDLTTGLGGPVTNPRLGAPDVPLDNIETFSVTRDDNAARFETDEFGLDGRGTFFVEFIYDGVSPFDFAAQGSTFDAELALYDEVGNLVFASDDPSLGLNASISNSDIAGGLPAGRYFLASAAFSATFGDGFEVQTEFNETNQPVGTLLITLESNVIPPSMPDPTLLSRLQSFTAPEVRRSFFQDDGAPINTEKLFLTALEGGSIDLSSAQNIIDEICVNETHDFVLNSSTTINIDTLNALWDVTLTAVEDITISNLTAGGDVSVTTNTNITGSNLVAGGSFNFFGGPTDLTGIDAGGEIAIDALGPLRATDIVAAGNFRATATENVVISQLQSGGDADISATNAAVLTSLDIAGSLAVSSQLNDIVVDDIQAGSVVSLSAGDDIRLGSPEGIRRLVAPSLILNAANLNNDNFNGVFLFTDVDSISSFTGSGGELFVNELSDVDLPTLETTSGSISLRAGGTISAGSVGVARPGHDITLAARGDDADIALSFASVLGSDDTIRLFADDDVTAASVTAGNLRVQALNLTGDQDVSVQLNTTVRTLNVDAGLLSNGNPNRGDIVVTESNPLFLTRAVAANGKILVTANGNLSTGNVQSNGISGENAIELVANGIGSDLITSRVAVKEGTGGVALTAADDIIDGNINDRLAVVASSVSYTAGNNTVDAFNGIIGNSFSPLISTTITSNTEAGVFLFNFGNTTVDNSSITNGRFSLTNRTGSATINDLSILSSSINNRIFVKTEGVGGDVLAGSIDAGVNGIVTIDSADDVLDTALLDNFFVTAQTLNVTARNNRADSFDGILLNIDVDVFSDVVFNDGETFVREA